MTLSKLASVARIAALALVSAFLIVLPAAASPTFPASTGRVVDEAQLLSPEQEAALTQKLAALEAKTSDQLVVVTVASLQDYPIEDYGYQLGRFWNIGQKGTNNGVLLIVAPNDRKVRIEVGYGLEPILTDALSSVIIQGQILPKFREGDFPGGIDAGVNAISEQMTADPAEAKKRADAAAKAPKGDDPLRVIPGVLIFLLVLWFMMGRARRRSGLLGGVLGGLASGGWSSGGGGWSSGGGSDSGGFSGGGGSFGGGGSSGSW
jgi:uncharacterized protein